MRTPARSRPSRASRRRPPSGSAVRHSLPMVYGQSTATENGAGATTPLDEVVTIATELACPLDRRPVAEALGAVRSVMGDTRAKQREETFLFQDTAYTP